MDSNPSRHLSNRSRTSKNEKRDSNLPLKDSNPPLKDSNPISRELKLKKLKKEIQIPMEWIRIPFLVSLAEDQDSNPWRMDSNLNFKKVQKGLPEEVIRILVQRIRIWIPIRFAQMDGFESPPKRFESQVKKKKWSWGLCIRILPRWIRFPYEKLWRTSEESEERFESLTRRFESLDLELWRTWKRFESSQ